MFQAPPHHPTTPSSQPSQPPQPPPPPSESLVLKPGFFRFTETSSDVRECPYEKNCKWPNGTGEGICIKGAVGPLCGKCDNRYYLRDAVAQCVACITSSSWYIGPLVGLLILIMGLVVLYSQKARILEFKEKYHQVKVLHWHHAKPPGQPQHHSPPP